MKRGFTLIEVVCTTAIVAILAGIAIVAMHFVSQSVKADRTAATIAKIDTYLSSMYGDYEQRRLPNLVSPTFAPIPASIRNAELAGRRLDAVRDLMRMEMPDRWSDVTNGPLVFLWSGGLPWIDKKPHNAIKIQIRYEKAKNFLLTKYSLVKAEEILNANASAKLLYLVVTAYDPEASDQFREDEISRHTDDELPVFVDGWGNPIRFLRWAPGLDQSEIQPTVIPIDDATSRKKAFELSPDHLNPTNIVRQGSLTAPHTTEVGWRLLPIIYSAGSDEGYGIYDPANYSYSGNPYYLFTGQTPVCSLGSSVDSSRYDNITSHR
ncbi:prepilin-type N-terminal cleavage/methylation domain-containing protein [Candidatus Pacearchaeota archaeon]|jgi:prepilin-type N-terminal cleavage/methylation domain-containing protein|nr:prepilin-type N-terminal cleavage/methylation domain-containing protein [Candidatus Pacearchaeota archaeon]